MHKCKLAYFLISLALPYVSSGQNIDSLIEASKSWQSQNLYDSAAKTYNELGYEYQFNNFDSSNFWLYKTLELTTNNINPIYLADANRMLAQNIYRTSGNLDSTILYYQKAHEYWELFGDSLAIADNHFSIGKMYVELGDYPGAMRKFQLSLSQYVISGDSNGIADTYNSMAIVFSKQNNFEDAITYNQKSSAINRKLGNMGPVGINYNNIGLTYKKMGEYDKSLEAYRYGLQIEKEIVFPVLRGALYNNIGNVYEILQDYDSAVFFQSEAVKLFQSHNYTSGIGWGYKGLASAHLAKNELSRAIKFGLEAHRIGQQTNDLDIKKQSAQVLSEAFAGVSDYQSAYQYQKAFKTYSDSMFSEASIRKVTELELAYQHKKEEELRDLQQQKEEAILKAEIEDEKYFRNLVLIGLLLSTVIGIVFIRNYLLKKRANKLLEEKNRIISEQADNLQRLNTTKDKFFSIVSHDLRGPMSLFNNQGMLIKAMLKEKSYKELDEFSDSISETAKSVTQLLDNLLNWAIQQQGEFPYNPERIDLKACVQENILIFEPIAQAKNITLRDDVPPNTHIWADKNSLLTILRNLINNALKFTESGGEVKVSMESEDQFALIRVSDTGVGIPAEKLEHIFDFEEKEVSYGTTGEKGVGLGLQLVKEFVKLNKGKINVDSFPGKGTTFILSVPFEPV